MARTTRVIKNDKGNDLEIYVDNCNVCSAEMIIPKSEADKLESFIPFLKEKIEKGSPCVNCLKAQVENGSFSLFSDQELAQLKDIIFNNKNK